MKNWLVTVDEGMFGRVRFGPFPVALDAVCFAAGLQLPELTDVAVQPATPWAMDHYFEAAPVCQQLMRAIAKARVAKGIVSRVRSGEFSLN